MSVLGWKVVAFSRNGQEYWGIRLLNAAVVLGKSHWLYADSNPSLGRLTSGTDRKRAYGADNHTEAEEYVQQFVDAQLLKNT